MLQATYQGLTYWAIGLYSGSGGTGRLVGVRLYFREGLSDPLPLSDVAILQDQQPASEVVAPAVANEAIDDRVAALLQAGSGIGLTYNDAGNALTIANTAPVNNEAIDDRVAALLQAGSGISLTYNDAANTLTVANTQSKLKLRNALFTARAAMSLPVLASPPTFSTSGPGGSSPIASAVTIAYNNNAAVSFRGLLPLLRSQFGADYWSNGCNGDWTRPPFWVEFNHYGASFAIQFRDVAGGSSASFWVWVDLGDGNGFRPATSTSQASSADAGGSLFYYRVTFSGAAQRRIRVCLNLADYGGIDIGPTDSISALQTSQQVSIAFFGDSYVEGAASVADTDLLAVRIGEALGSLFNYYRCGQGGTGYVSNGGGGGKEIFAGSNRIASLVSVNPEYIVVLGSVNDDASFASAQASAANFYSVIATQLPNTRIIVVGPQSTSGAPSSNRNSNNTAVKNAALAAPNVIAYVDSIGDSYITGTGRVGATTGSGNADIMIASDAVHPTATGHLYWATRLYASIVNALYTYSQS
jgi:hypothetical protein